jgi:hypothetical protein
VRLDNVCAEAQRAGDCLGDVRDDAVVPAADLVPEQPRPAQRRHADGARVGAWTGRIARLLHDPADRHQGIAVAFHDQNRCGGLSSEMGWRASLAVRGRRMRRGDARQSSDYQRRRRALTEAWLRREHIKGPFVYICAIID